jgi:hypothetical protein
MGFNCGFLFIRTTREITATRAAQHVASYWRARGAAIEATEFVVLGRDALADGRLAYALVPIDDLWICVTDSESYPHEGAALAAFLAGALATQVTAVDVCDVCDPPEERSERHHGTVSPEQPPSEYVALDYRALCQDDANRLAAHLGIDMAAIRYLVLHGIPGPLPVRAASVVDDDGDIAF